MAHPSAPVEFRFSWIRALVSIGLIALIIVGIVVLRTYMDSSNPQGRYQVVGERSYTVETRVLTAGDVAQGIEASGTVQAARQVDLRPLNGGQLIYVNPNLRDGGRVTAGEVLIKIDAANFELALRQAQNALKDAQSSAARLAADVARQEGQVDLQRQQLALAQAELARRQSLLTQGIIPQGTFDQAQTSTLAQRQSLSGAENALAQLREQLDATSTQVDTATINVDLAQKSLDDTVLTAPFDALVVLSTVQAGQLVTQGDLAARLLDMAGLEVQFRLPADLFSRLSQADGGGILGRETAVRWPGQVTDTPLSGTVVRQGSTFDAISSGVPLYTALGPEAFAAGLRPGAFVSVALTGQSFGNVFAIPRDVYFEGLGETGGIYVVVEQPLVELPEWQGPTSIRDVARATAWFAERAVSEGSQANLGQHEVPQWLASDGVVTVADLFECKASNLVGEDPSQRGGRGGRRGGNNNERPGQASEADTGQNAGQAAAGNNARRGGQTNGGGNRPALTPAQSRALCPVAIQTVAAAMPATLLTYAGDQALISGAGLDGQLLVTQAFDALANGTWLTLPDALSDTLSDILSDTGLGE